VILLAGDDLTPSKMCHPGFEPGTLVLEFGIETSRAIHSTHLQAYFAERKAKLRL